MKGLMKVKEKANQVMDKMNYHMIAGAMIIANGVITLAEERDIFDVAKDSAGSIYTKVLMIDTPIAAVSIIIAMLVSMFSHNQKVIDESRQIAKSVAIAWLVINLIGAIFAFGKNLVGSDKSDSVPDFN